MVEYLGEYFFQSEWDGARRGLYAWAIDPYFGEGAHVLDAFEYRNVRHRGFCIPVQHSTELTWIGRCLRRASHITMHFFAAYLTCVES